MAPPDWTTYFWALSAFAGTVFALVLAARQIRGHRDSEHDPKELSSWLAESIAVTAELAAAAAFGILFQAQHSFIFNFYVCLVALVGVGLSGRAILTWVQARLSGRLKARMDVIVALGNVLPLACYVVAFLYGVGKFSLEPSNVWGFAFVVTWLTFSGCWQAIFWYAQVWRAESPGLSS